MPVLSGLPPGVKEVLWWADRLVWHPIPILLGVGLWLLLREPRYALLFLGGYQIEMATKLLVQRGRWGDTGVYTSAHEFGFPSGDVLAVTLMAMLAKGRWRVLVVLAPLTIGLARMSVHGHYPLDVVAGCLLALGWFELVWNQDGGWPVSLLRRCWWL